jgi:hypothetical protein
MPLNRVFLLCALLTACSQTPVKQPTDPEATLRADCSENTYGELDRSADFGGVSERCVIYRVEKAEDQRVKKDAFLAIADKQFPLIGRAVRETDLKKDIDGLAKGAGAFKVSLPAGAAAKLKPEELTTLWVRYRTGEDGRECLLAYRYFLKHFERGAKAKAAPGITTMGMAVNPDDCGR